MLTTLRNRILHALYIHIAKPIFFRMDPEDAHDRANRMGRILGSNPLTRFITKCFFGYSSPLLEQNILGMHFKNPIGLAAGFDKNAQLTDILPCVGFGHAEVGSITGEPCEGNPKPRLWRLPKSRSLLVYYGLKNNGCEEIANRLRKKRFAIPIGTSVAKTNSPGTVDEESGIKDYVKAFSHFTDIGSYMTINISCPNAFGGEPFTDPRKLDHLLTATDRIKTKKPIFLKVSPDLPLSEIDELIKVAKLHHIQGFVCTNLTKKCTNRKLKEPVPSEKGGMSGKVVEDLANNLIRHVYNKTQGSYVIIGCGGVSTAEDAYKKIKLGASLIHMISGMIFEGPQVVSEINRGLVELLRKDGYNSISDAIGVDNK